MNTLDTELSRRLAVLREQGLHRQLQRVDSPQSPRIKIDGRTFLNFSSNDYLGLANEPALKEAAARAVDHHGAGSGSSRLLCGSLAVHQELEETLASFKGTAAALSFSSGYTTALGTICALAGKDDVIVLDKRVHACIVDAARLSGAKLRVFAHNDLNDLERILKWAGTRAGSAPLTPGASPPRILLVTESVFSMDGDHAPLRELVVLKEQYGAWLMLDEAHATGLYGNQRRGLAEQFGVSDRIEIHMGTLGKAVGSAGGYVCGSRTLIDFLINRARSFIFSTAPVPAAAAAAAAGVRFIQSQAGLERLDRLWERTQEFNSKLILSKSKLPGPIVPILVGAETKAVEAAGALREAGLFIPAIRYPTVARNQARLRVTLTAAHTAEEVSQLAAALYSLADRFPLAAHGSRISRK